MVLYSSLDMGIFFKPRSNVSIIIDKKNQTIPFRNYVYGNGNCCTCIRKCTEITITSTPNSFGFAWIYSRKENKTATKALTLMAFYKMRHCSV